MIMQGQGSRAIQGISRCAPLAFICRDNTERNGLDYPVAFSPVIAKVGADCDVLVYGALIRGMEKAKLQKSYKNSSPNFLLWTRIQQSRL